MKIKSDATLKLFYTVFLYSRIVPRNFFLFS